MSLNLPADVDTQQPFMPVVKEGVQGKLSGANLFWRSVAALKTAVGIERNNIATNAILAIWIPGTPLQVAQEPGYRIWTQDLVTPANSHARTFVFPNGRLLDLPSDDNTVRRTTGAPSSSGTTVGDRAIDLVTGLLYTWGSTWDAGVQYLPPVVSGGGSAGLPGAPTVIAAVPGVLRGTIAYAPPASDGGSAIIDYEAAYSGGSSNPNPTGSGLALTVTGIAAAVAGTLAVRARNANGPGPWATSSAITPTAVPTPVIARAGAANGQWNKPQVKQNRISGGGDYSMLGSAGQGGQAYVTKLAADGTPIGTHSFGVFDNNDDHNTVVIDELPDGTWFAVFNRHGITGVTGFFFARSQTPHELDFGPLVNIPGTLGGSSRQSTYVQLFMVQRPEGLRMVVTHRIGSSSGGSHVLWYSDDWGRTWTESCLLHAYTYMESEQVGDILHCVCYMHPVTGTNHHIRYFGINLLTGAVSGDEFATTVGNVYTPASTSTAVILAAQMRMAYTCPAGMTTRMYQLTNLSSGLCIGMQVMPEGGGSPGTYYLAHKTTSGEFLLEFLGGTGNPSLAGQMGYFGSCAPLNAEWAIRSVNLGPTGVGSWSLDVLRKIAGTWQVVDTIHTTANIIMRLFWHRGRVFWTTFTSYASFSTFAGFISSLLYAAVAWTPLTQVAPVADPFAGAATAPAAPTDIVITPINGGLRIGATPGASNGAAQDKFRVTITSTDPDIVVENTTLPVIVTGLTNGTAYTGTICGHNSAGYGAESGEFTGTPAAGSGGETVYVPVAKVQLINATEVSPNVIQTIDAIEGEGWGGITWTGQRVALGAEARIVLDVPDSTTTSATIATDSSGTATAARSSMDYGVQISSTMLLSSVVNNVLVSLGYSVIPGEKVALYFGADNTVRCQTSATGADGTWVNRGAAFGGLRTGSQWVRIFTTRNTALTPPNRMAHHPVQWGLT